MLGQWNRSKGEIREKWRKPEVDGRTAVAGERGGYRKGGGQLGSRAANGWGGRAEKIRDRWEGMFRSTGKAVEDGGRMDINPFWDIQYPERTERRFGGDVKRDGTGQCGCWSVSRNKDYGQNLHPGIFWVQGRCDAGAKPTLRRRHAILPGIPHLLSPSDTLV